MKKRILFIFLVCFFALNCVAKHPDNAIQNIRIWPSPESTRVVFDLNKALHYEMKVLENNTVIQLDMENVSLKTNLEKLNLESTRIKSIHHYAISAEKSRIELKLIHALNPKIFSLTPNQQYGHRLVIDLEMNQNEKDAILALFEADAPIAMPQNTVQQPVKEIKNELKKIHAPFIVAIDPGHGGEDPGAVGKNGTKEKDVVLAIAKYLKEYIDKEPNMRAVLIRKGDYYIPLHERVSLARSKKCDLFVSIHADAFHDKRAQGASVFTLSERGASSAAARWLAEKENKSDLIGGVKLDPKNKILASVLLDLSQTKSKEQGNHAAKHILKSLGNLSTLHKPYVEQAGFAVLKAPDIPSLLVETEFISNLRGEAKLKTRAHQKKIAHAIFSGIRNYAHKRH